MRNDNLQILLLKPVFLKDSFFGGGRRSSTLFTFSPKNPPNLMCFLGPKIYLFTASSIL